jgi:hypothetical protein
MIKGLLTLILGANTKGLDQALGRSGRKMKMMAGVTDLAKGALIGFGTAALVALGANVVNTILRFDKAMVGLAAILGTTRDEMKALERQAIALGGSTIFTANQVGDLQTILARFGFDQSEIEASTAAVLDLAAAANIDLSTAADASAATLRAFGLDAQEMTRVVDAMTNAFTKSALTVETYGQAMVYAAPLATAAGSSIEETSAALAILADNGIRGSIAGTGLRRIFTNLAKEGKTLTDIFKESNKSIKEQGDALGFAKDAVGQFALSSFVVLAKNADKLEETTEKMGEAGSASMVASQQLGSLSNKILILKSAWERLILSIESGDGIFGKLAGNTIDGITGVLGGISAIIQKINEVNDAVSIDMTEGEETVFNFLKNTAQGAFTPMGMVKKLLVEIGEESQKVAEGTDWQDSSLTSYSGPFGELNRMYYDLAQGREEIAAMEEAHMQELARAAKEQVERELKEQERLKIAYDNQKRAELEAMYDVSVYLDTVTGQYQEILTLKKRIMETSLEPLAEGPKSRSIDGSSGGVPQAPFGGSLALPSDPINTYLQTLIDSSSDLIDKNEELKNSYMNLGKSISSALSQGAQSMEDYKIQVINSLLDIGLQYAINAITASVATAAQAAGGMGPLGLIALPALLGMAVGLVKTSLNQGRSDAVTAFADGGIVYGPTLGLMGEYSGAKNNPEVIAPLDKLKDLMPAGNQTVDVNVIGKIAGSTIRLVMDRENKRYKKYGGG